MRPKAVVLLILFAAVLPARAEEDWSAEAVAARLERARQELAGLPEASSDTDRLRRAALQARVALLEELVRTRNEAAGLMDPAEIERRRETAVRELAARRTGPARPQSGPEQEADLAALEAEARRAEAERSERQSVLDQLRERRNRAEAELKTLPAREAEARGRLGAAADNPDRTLVPYLAENARIELRLVEERTRHLRTALERWAQRAAMHESELDLAKASHETAQRALTRAREQFAQRQASEAKRQKEQADAAARRAEAERNPLTRFRLRVAAEVERRRAQRKEVEGRRTALALVLAEEKEALAELEKERLHLEQRLELRGDGAAKLLRATLDRVRAARALIEGRRLPDLYADVEANQFALVDVLDRLWDLQLPESENPDWRALAAQAPADAARVAFHETLRGPEGLLAALRDLKTALEQLDSGQRELEGLYARRVAALDTFVTFVLSHIYWVRSEPALDPAFFAESVRDFSRFAGACSDADVARGVRDTVRRAPLRSAGVLAVLGALFVGLLLVRSRFRLLSPPSAPAAPPAGRKAFGRILGCVLAAAAAPLVLLAAAHLIRIPGFPVAAAGPVSRMLELLSLFWFVRRLSATFLSERGAGAALLAIPGALGQQIHRSIGIATLSAALFYAPARVLAAPPFGLEHFPRLLHTAWLAGIAASLIAMLRRRGALIRSWSGGRGPLAALWSVLCPLLAAALAALVAMSAMGYTVGADMLMTNAVQTFVLALLLAGLYLLLRRLVDGLARRAHERTRADDDARAGREVTDVVVSQLTRVVWAFLILLAAVFLVDFWNLGETLRGALESVRLATLADGGRLTLYDLAVAALWIAGGHFVVHNLSGVFEFLVFPLVGDPGTGNRFVLLAIARYAILLVAYSAALLALKFSLASIGWLIAAASVGIGFGLQEIIANFVSGLILLFERPIRVGDIITVGDTGGVVERINIRATVVTNWDRQQIIVPNRNFVTENLTNWTRNDNVTRRKVSVGVAYGTDAGTVMRVLSEVVRGVDGVLREPQPRIWFEDFADSALLFEVWFFCPVDQGKPLTTAVRLAIQKRFAAEEIEIAFPQLDLHLRSADALDAWAGLLERRATRPEPGGAHRPGR